MSPPQASRAVHVASTSSTAFHRWPGFNMLMPEIIQSLAVKGLHITCTCSGSKPTWQGLQLQVERLSPQEAST